MAVSAAERFAKTFAKKYKKANRTDHVVLCPSFVSLPVVSSTLQKTKTIELGAQDISWEVAGNFTGEVSPQDLRQLKVRYVIIGHSERRQILGETDESVQAKVNTAIDHNIVPIICVGETKAERTKGATKNVLTKELVDGLKGCKGKRLLIAYEPLWAISQNGKGSAMNQSQITEAMQTIQSILKTRGIYKRFSSIALLYGGSVSAKNSSEIMNLPLVDGVLVGNASLSVSEFLRIAH